ncbi:SigB/SigF/SigG family RNA polymerase sigma factor [Actinoplanes sp. TBRC 11911]|uniref:SigB/SigF/SigG family RNA polymerase sigma factor n=1 Tax=Actinoplanes sp. TBRC 11911 TaxID=2729386 RepID=UPI0037C19676
MHAHVASGRTAADEVATGLVEAYATADPADPARARLREQVIEAWLPLAQHLARRYNGRGEPADDLYQVAALGMIKAVDRFDASRGIEFTAFAIPTIVGEVKRHFRDRTWAVRVPRRLQELRLAISGANNDLNQTLGRAPTVADIAAHLKITEEEVLEGLEGGRAYTATSLSAPVNDEGAIELSDTLGEIDANFELTENRASLPSAMATLDDRERAIVKLRFYGEMSQSEIGEKLGISQMHVSRLLARAVRKLRVQLMDEPVRRAPRR